MLNNMETNNNKEFYIEKEGKCSKCNQETLMEENPVNDTGNGYYDLYAITFCKSCGYWYNNVMDDYFTKEELQKHLK